MESPRSLPEDRDMVFSVEPISYIFPVAIVEPGEQSESTSVEKPRKRRDLSQYEVVKESKVIFKLLQYQDVHNMYILEMHEVETGIVSMYQLEVNESELTVKTINNREHITISSTVHIIKSPFPSSSELSLRERLGEWTIEERKHVKSKRTNKFFYHRKLQKIFRSMQEVATFIFYNNYKMKLVNFEDTEGQQEMEPMAVSLLNTKNKESVTENSQPNEANEVLAKEEYDEEIYSEILKIPITKF